jgi:tRNA(Ile)-lysidine synthase TilS/MesJ
MKLQQLYSYTRRAIDDYQMIDSGDKIAVGISGGKDSLTLLYALHGLKRFYPQKFELIAITVNLGYQEFDVAPLQNLCEKLEIPYEEVRTDIGDIVFQKNPKENPCSLCAKLRKGALNDAAKRLGCNKVAYAHHKDDIIETMVLSLIFEGRFHSFSPKTYLDRTELTVIRPMMYLSEADVIGFKNRMNLPVVKNPCPVDGHTKRQYAKDLLRQLNLDHPGTKDCMFTAIINGNIAGWPPKNPNPKYANSYKTPRQPD